MKKGFANMQTLFSFIGGTSGGRTHDKRIKSPLLYQLSYGPVSSCSKYKKAKTRSLKL